MEFFLIFYLTFVFQTLENKTASNKFEKPVPTLDLFPNILYYYYIFLPLSISYYTWENFCF